EFVSESKTAVRTFDQTRNVGDRRPAIARELYHADDRMQCGKRIRCHLWTRRRTFSEQRRFARVGVTNQRSIRARAQFQEKMALPIRSPNHVATASPITATRSAFLHKFLPPKTHAPTATVARLREHFDSIDKHVSGKVEAWKCQKTGIENASTPQRFIKRF